MGCPQHSGYLFLQTAKGGYADELYKKMGFVIDRTISWSVKSFEGD